MKGDKTRAIRVSAIRVGTQIYSALPQRYKLEH
jgi:hypothetical protein